MLKNVHIQAYFNIRKNRISYEFYFESQSKMLFIEKTMLWYAIVGYLFNLFMIWIDSRHRFRFKYSSIIKVFIQVYLEVSSISTYIFDYVWIMFLQLCLSQLEATRAVFRSRYLLAFKISDDAFPYNSRFFWWLITLVEYQKAALLWIINCTICSSLRLIEP